MWPHTGHLAWMSSACDRGVMWWQVIGGRRARSCQGDLLQSPGSFARAILTASTPFTIQHCTFSVEWRVSWSRPTSYEQYLSHRWHASHRPSAYIWTAAFDCTSECTQRGQSSGRWRANYLVTYIHSTLPLREQCLWESYNNEHTAAYFCQNAAQDKGTNTHLADKPWGQKMQKHTRTHGHKACHAHTADLHTEDKRTTKISTKKRYIFIFSTTFKLYALLYICHRDCGSGWGPMSEVTGCSSDDNIAEFASLS